MAGTALKRLMAEYKQLTLNPPEGIVAGPVNEENFFEWEALIMGPEDTCFEGGVFPAILSFPSDYPLSPPKMKFTCDMFHPNSELLSPFTQTGVYASRFCMPQVMTPWGMRAVLRGGALYKVWRRYCCLWHKMVLHFV
ncbi:ubiquitin-conjugating enzyme E2 G2 isoform X2 [Electrophorus electricus]|uniref:ubiquitin-conjugating enzyme E2 G2 isoform X2 n=1 Tax=Electrophorus electricus TaxID=8005 RepID=UPI000F0A2088|nr:ubiquitin-conjugating enzyme E2 G2 isoform X2 [Electrophorus electricus]